MLSAELRWCPNCFWWNVDVISAAPLTTFCPLYPAAHWKHENKLVFFRIMTDSSNDRFLSSWHNCGRGRNKGRETESSWMGILAKKVPSTTAWKKVLTTWTDGRKTETNVSVFVKGDSCYKQTSKPKQASFNDSNRISFLLFIYTYSWMFSLPTRKCTKYWSC